jgi:hypothetical protein
MKRKIDVTSRASAKSASKGSARGGVMRHELKTDPEVFQAVLRGEKLFEIRFDDRGFMVGDHLLLIETEFTGEEMKAGKPLVYTGDAYDFEVNYILRGPIYGLKEGWVIMS